MDNGRPAWDPVRLLGVLVLQFVLRAPDRQAAEMVQYDGRWRLALHMMPAEVTFDPSLLVVFRNRLVEGAQEGLAFAAVLDYLVEHGWVPKRSRQRLDSTHVRGLLSLMNRLECARETIRLLLEDVVQKTRAQPTGAMRNPHEPEAQWSSKSTTRDKAWVGYKAQVAETVQDQPRATGEPTASFLTAIATQNAPASDKAGMAQVAAEQQGMGLCMRLRPSMRMVRTSAAKDSSMRRTKAASCTAPPRPRRTAAKSLCAQCVSAGQDHRTSLVGALHTLLQERRREMQTEAYK